MEGGAVDRAPARLLLLLGITQRSGTSYVSELLMCHPAIRMREPISEDFVLAKSSPLFEFVADVIVGWQENLDTPDDEGERFLRALGRGIESFFTEGVAAAYVLAKTPSSENASAATSLFPDAPVIFLVRDGRAMSESFALSFGGTWQAAARLWARNGRTIIAELARRSGDPNVVLLRYEDVVADPVGSVMPVIERIGLDPADFDSELAMRLPVTGSSVFRGGAGLPLHWEPVEATSDFRPLERADHWTPKQRRAFNAIAADVMSAFGYDT